MSTTTGPNRRTVLCGLAAALAAPGALAACSSDAGEFQPGTPTQAAPQTTAGGGHAAGPGPGRRRHDRHEGRADDPARPAHGRDGQGLRRLLPAPGHHGRPAPERRHHLPEPLQPVRRRHRRAAQGTRRHRAHRGPRPRRRRLRAGVMRGRARAARPVVARTRRLPVGREPRASGAHHEPCAPRCPPPSLRGAGRAPGRGVGHRRRRDGRRRGARPALGPRRPARLRRPRARGTAGQRRRAPSSPTGRSRSSSSRPARPRRSPPPARGRAPRWRHCGPSTRSPPT